MNWPSSTATSRRSPAASWRHSRTGARPDLGPRPDPPGPCEIPEGKGHVGREVGFQSRHDVTRSCVAAETLTAGAEMYRARFVKVAQIIEGPIMTALPSRQHACHPRLHLLRGGDLLLRFHILLLLDRHRRPDPAGDDAHSRHLRIVHFAGVARERALSGLPPAANYADRVRLLRVLVLLRLLHEHGIHGARPRARRRVEHHRP